MEDEPVLEVFHNSYPLVTEPISTPISSASTITTVENITSLSNNNNHNNEDYTSQDRTALPPLISNVPIHPETHTVDIHFNDEDHNDNDDEEAARRAWDQLDNDNNKNNPTNTSSSTVPIPSSSIISTGNTTVNANISSSSSSLPSSSTDTFDISYQPFRVGTNSNNSSTSSTADEFDQELHAITHSRNNHHTTNTNVYSATTGTTTTAASTTANNNTTDDDDEFDNDFSDDALTDVPTSTVGTHYLAKVVLNVANVPMTVIPATPVDIGAVNEISDIVPHAVSLSSSALDHVGDALRSLQSSLATETTDTKESTTTNGSSGTTTTISPTDQPPLVPTGPPRAPLGALVEGDENEEEEDEEEEDEEEDDEDNANDDPSAVIPTSAQNNMNSGTTTSMVRLNPAHRSPDSPLNRDTEHAELEAAFNVATVLASAGAFRSSSPSSPSSLAAVTSTPAMPSVTFLEAASYLLSPEQINPYRKSIIVEDPPNPNRTCSAWFGSLFDTPLREGCWYERDAVFSVAKMKYEPNDTVHVRLMRTLYSLITGKDITTQVSSWMDIGFQRDADFSTDLRAGGMLGPLQMLYLIDTYPWLIRLLSINASSPVRGFPLMITAINFTTRTLQCIRSGKLNRTFNRAFQLANHLQKQRKITVASTTTTDDAHTSSSLPLAPSVVSTVANDLYCALLYNFIEEYDKRKATIQTIGVVMQSITQQCLTVPDRTIDNFRAEHRRQVTENSQGKVTNDDGITIAPTVGSRLPHTLGGRTSPSSARSLAVPRNGLSNVASPSSNGTPYHRNFSEL